MRNDLVQEIKTDLQNPKTQKVIQLTQKLFQTLPQDRSYWNYGALPGGRPIKKAINPQSREIFNHLTTELVADNLQYQEYLKLIKRESEFSKKVYGYSKRDHKNYAQNKALGDFPKTAALAAYLPWAKEVQAQCGQ